jgi:cytochrome c
MSTFNLKAVTITASLMFLGTTGSALALDGEALFKNPKKGGCTACHGKDGKTTIMPMYPKIAGQNEAYLLQQMKDIKSGARNNGMTVAMKGVMHMVNDEEMAAIAKYLSTLQP